MAPEEHIEVLEKEIGSLKTALSGAEEKISCLEEQLSWFKRQIFGKRSEKITSPYDAVPLLPGIEIEPLPQKPETKIVPTHERRKPNRNG